MIAAITNWPEAFGLAAVCIAFTACVWLFVRMEVRDSQRRAEIQKLFFERMRERESRK